jgi:hypothetical protein
MGTWEHIKLRELPWHNTLRVLLLGEIPQNTHRNKNGVAYILFYFHFIKPSFILKQPSIIKFIVPGFVDATQHWKKRKHLIFFKNKD